MKTRLNSRQKLVLINALSGMNQTEAYDKVYGPNPNSYTLASDLFRKPHFKAELERLQDRQIAKLEKTILSPSERKRILSEIAKSEYQIEEETTRDKGKKTTRIKRKDPIQAIAELNKMDGSYAPSKHLIGQKVQFEVVHVERRDNAIQRQIETTGSTKELGSTEED